MSTGLKFFGTLKFVPPHHVFLISSNLRNDMMRYSFVSAVDSPTAACSCCSPEPHARILKAC